MSNRILKCALTLLGGGLGILLAAAPAFASVLEFIEAVPMPMLTDVQATSVAVSLDGGHVYVAAGNGDALVAFARNASTGELSEIQTLLDNTSGVDGLQSVGSVTVSPDGRHVFTASTRDDAVAAFSRDAATGLLTFVEAEFEGVGGVLGVESAHMVTTSPDGAHVYVASPGDTATSVPPRVSVFARNALTGELTFGGVVTDDVGGVTGLGGVVSVMVSPDGGYAYTTAFRDDALAVFERNAATGALSFVEVQTDGVGGVDGLNGASELAFSPEGTQVYVSSLNRFGVGENAVATFDRNATTGEVTFRDVLFDGVDGVSGLDQPSSIVVTPDGKLAFTAAVVDNSLAVFRRDSETGLLDFKEAQFDGTHGVDGLEGARWVDVSSDGAHVYVAGLLEAKVAVFAIVGSACDFNDDFACDINDIDALVMEIVAGTNDPDFDLTGDGLVDFADIDDPANGWLAQAGEENIGPGRAYLIADANLDEFVDGLDFIAWNENRFTMMDAWSAGDWNADGFVDGSDFIQWNENRFMGSDAVAAVPEPHGVLLVILALAFLSPRRRA